MRRKNRKNCGPPQSLSQGGTLKRGYPTTNFEEGFHAAIFKELDSASLPWIGDATEEKTCTAWPMLDGEQKGMIYFHFDGFFWFVDARGNRDYSRGSSRFSPF